MVARAAPRTFTAPQQQRKRRRRKVAGQPCRRRRRKTQQINKLIKQALSARKPCGGMSLSSLRAVLLANGYDVEENRPRLQMAIGQERRRQKRQRPPHGRKTDAATATGCLRGGRNQKAEKQKRRNSAPTRERSSPKKKPANRKKCHCKRLTAGRKWGKALRDSRIGSRK